MEKLFFRDTRDVAHNAGFYLTAQHLRYRNFASYPTLMYDWVKKTLFSSLLWPIKDPAYFWSNSEGLTKWLYDKILSKFAIDPRKGTNPDQCQPLLIYAALRGNVGFIWHFSLGLLLRCGFFPNGEHICLKIHHLSPIFRAFHIKPLYWLTDILFYVSVRHSFRVDYKKSTTRKVRAFLFLTQAENQPTVWTKLAKGYIQKIGQRKGFPLHVFWKEIFREYFGDNSDIFLKMPYSYVSGGINIWNVLFSGECVFF